VIATVHYYEQQFSGVKSESTSVDQAAAVEQAKRLYKAGVGRMGTDDDVFIDILTTQSRAQIQAIKQEYEKQQSSSLKKAIEKETSGAFEKALIALLSPSITAYTAQALRESFDGVGVVSDIYLAYFVLVYYTMFPIMHAHGIQSTYCSCML
jgi:Annexin